MKWSCLPARIIRNQASCRLGALVNPWKNRLRGAVLCVGLGMVICATALFAQSGPAVDGVTVKAGKVYSMRGDELEALTTEIKLPFEVKVDTNGLFKVAGGKERKIAEGQIIRSDGWILNPDGSVQPVFDHSAMLAGKVVVVKDGQPANLQETLVFSTGLRIAPDGTCVYPGGGSSRLADGQLFKTDGTPVPSKDTISFKNGRVVIQKSGKLISLTGMQIMGMNDGTKVYGTGMVQQRDGTVSQLHEGQTILVDGPAARQ